MPFEKAKLETTSGLIEFIETWCSKHDNDKNLFNGNQIQFKNYILEVTIFLGDLI